MKDIDGVPFEAKYIEALVAYMYYSNINPLPWDHSGWCVSHCRGWSRVKQKAGPEVDPVPGDDIHTHRETIYRFPADGHAIGGKANITGDCKAHPAEGVDFLITMWNLAEVSKPEVSENCSAASVKLS